MSAGIVSVNTALKESDIVFYNPKCDPFKIYGLYNYRAEKVYKRLPDDVATATSKGVASLAFNTAGGRVRFSTDSEYVAINAVMPHVSHLSHMPLTGSGGFDLYIDGDGGSRYFKNFMPSSDMTAGYESAVHFGSRKMRNITINFPSYNYVNELYIGLQKDAKVGVGEPYLVDLPVVFYGSSITQGACSSRPGLIYENFISRKYNLDYINLGFSGNGRAELPIVNYMATLPMLAFVSDYDHNAPNAEYLRETHFRMYEIIREAHPDIPYIMVSRPDCLNSASAYERKAVIVDSFREARARGDKNVYFIDGEGMFRGPFEDCCTVDGCHPNDLGMMKMAEAIGKMLERSLRGNPIFKEV